MSATASGAPMRAIQNPMSPPPKSLDKVKAIKAPIMYREPCATFGIRKTPRIRLNPEETMKRITVRLKPTNT